MVFSKGELVASKSYLILHIRKSSSAGVSYLISGGGFALLISGCLGNSKGELVASKSYL